MEANNLKQNRIEIHNKAKLKYFYQAQTIKTSGRMEGWHRVPLGVEE